MQAVYGPEQAIRLAVDPIGVNFAIPLISHYLKSKSANPRAAGWGVASLNKRRWRFARLAKRLEPDKALARKVKRVERMLLIKT
jgi:hypothetical protein